MPTPTQRLRAAIAAQPQPKRRGPIPLLGPRQLAAAIAAHTQPPVSPAQLAGELHSLELQHQLLGREIAQRRQQLAATA